MNWLVQKRTYNHGSLELKDHYLILHVHCVHDIIDTQYMYMYACVTFPPLSIFVI